MLFSGQHQLIILQDTTSTKCELLLMNDIEFEKKNLLTLIIVPLKLVIKWFDFPHTTASSTK